MEVSKNGKWVTGEVEAIKGKKYKIHYSGTNHTKDEMLPGSRLRMLQEEVVVEAEQEAPVQSTGFKKGDFVTVTIYVPNEATILEVNDGKFKVHYEDVEREDEWVTEDKISALNAGDTKAGPPPGRYICYHPMYGNSYMGTFIIPAKGTYQYETGLKGKGSYTYNAATRKITWVGGDLAGKTVSTSYYNTEQNGPLIEIVFPKGKRAGDIQNCLCKEKF